MTVGADPTYCHVYVIVEVQRPTETYVYNVKLTEITMSSSTTKTKDHTYCNESKSLQASCVIELDLIVIWSIDDIIAIILTAGVPLGKVNTNIFIRTCLIIQGLSNHYSDYFLLIMHGFKVSL